MRAARLERHHERLPGRVHDGVGDLETALVDPRQDLQRHADPRFGARLAPRDVAHCDGLEQLVEVELGIGDAKRHAIGRNLAAHATRGTRQQQRKWLAQQSVEAALPASAAPSP